MAKQNYTPYSVGLSCPFNLLDSDKVCFSSPAVLSYKWAFHTLLADCTQHPWHYHRTQFSPCCVSLASSPLSVSPDASSPPPSITYSQQQFFHCLLHHDSHSSHPIQLRDCLFLFSPWWICAPSLATGVCMSVSSSGISQHSMLPPTICKSNERMRHPVRPKPSSPLRLIGRSHLALES